MNLDIFLEHKLPANKSSVALLLDQPILLKKIMYTASFKS